MYEISLPRRDRGRLIVADPINDLHSTLRAGWNVYIQRVMEYGR